MSDRLIEIKGYIAGSNTFHSLENLKYNFLEKCTIDFNYQEFQFKIADFCRFQEMTEDRYFAIFKNQSGMGNLESDMDIVVLIVTLDEMILCKEVFNTQL